MPKFPEPPDPRDLAVLGAETLELPAGTFLWRIYFRSGPYPSFWDTWRFFGPASRSRFDHHVPPARVQDRAVYYAAGDVTTCVAEVFQEKRFVDLDKNQPWLVGFETVRELRLLDLTGTWPTAVGASMAISSGLRSRARRWSRAIHDAYPSVEGLWYPSSMHANQPAVVLYERASGALPAAPAFHRSLADLALRQTIDESARRLNNAVGLRLSEAASH